MNAHFSKFAFLIISTLSFTASASQNVILIQTRSGQSVEVSVKEVARAIQSDTLKNKTYSFKKHLSIKDGIVTIDDISVTLSDSKFRVFASDDNARIICGLAGLNFLTKEEIFSSFSEDAVGDPLNRANIDQNGKVIGTVHQANMLTNVYCK